MHHLAILEMDLGQGATDLRPQFDPVDRGKLTEKAGPPVDVALQRMTDSHDRRRSWRCRRLIALRREAAIGEEQGNDRRDGKRAGSPEPPPAWPARGVFIERLSLSSFA